MLLDSSQAITGGLISYCSGFTDVRHRGYSAGFPTNNMSSSVSGANASDVSYNPAFNAQYSGMTLMAHQNG